MTIDDKTVDDIVGLIEAEMGEADGDCVNSPKRLAGVILGRLGYELPKPSPLPAIMVTDWHITEIDGFYEIHGFVGDEFVIVAKEIHTLPNAKLIAAAPNLAEAGLAVAKLYLKIEAAIEIAHPGAGLSRHLWGENCEYENLIKALEKAGVDFESTKED